MITFLVTVNDDGDVAVRKLSDLAPAGAGAPQLVTGLVDRLADPSFQRADMKVGDRIDLHVTINERTRRDVVLSVLDDAIPQFASIEEAEQWMESRQSGTYSVSYG